jgi:hypothetical protein
MAYKPIHAKPSALVKVVTRGGVIVSAAAVVAAGAGAIGAGTADAETVPLSASASTYIANHPDSGGHGNNWAFDDFTRTLTVYQVSAIACAGVGSFDSSADICYSATVSDNGKFNAIPGQDVPNGSDSGQITHSVQGTMAGAASYTLYAPVADTLTGTVEKYQNDNFTDPTVTDHQSPYWPEQAFATPADVTVQYDSGAPGTVQNDWSYKYTDACESWTDSGLSDDGNLAVDGDITGKDCVTSHTGPGYVVNKNSGKALDVTGGVFAQGTGLQQWTKGAKSPSGVAGGDQQFEIVTENTGTSYLVAVDGSKDYYVTSSARGDQLTLSTYPSPGAVLDKAGPYYEFPNTRLVMDVTDWSKNSGAVVHGWSLTGATNQQWSLP